MIIRNTIWVLFERATQIIFIFFINGIIARAFSIAEYGYFQSTLAIITIFTSLTLICGAEVLLPKITSTKDNSASEIICSAFFLRLIFSIISYVFFIIYIILNNNQNIKSIASILGLIIILGEPFAVVTIWFQSKTNIKPIVIASTIANGIKLVLILWWILRYGLEIITLSYIWLGTTALQATFYASIYFYTLNKLKIKIKLTFMHFLSLLIEGLKYWPSLILMMIFFRIDRLLINHYSTSDDVGIYMAAMQIFDASLSLALLLSVSIAPILIYKYNDIIAIKKNTLKLAFILSLIGLLIFAIGYTIMPTIIKILFGGKYIEAITISRHALFITVFAFIESAFNIFLIKIKRPLFSFIKWLTVILVALPSEYFGFKYFDIEGLLFGIFAGYITSIFIGIYYFKFTPNESTISWSKN
jgi:polysaccharide transporter, PST family